jgi:4-alpha-glucanotransferase
MSVFALVVVEKEMGEWQMIKPILLRKDGTGGPVSSDLSEEVFPLAYKYGVYNKKKNGLPILKKGNNRIVFAKPEKRNLVVLHDGFIHLPNNTWKGAGVAIPVFSLRSKKSFGVGEFTDLKPLADWAKKTAYVLYRLLPVNDTIANHTGPIHIPMLQYPAFALHRIYINLEKVAVNQMLQRSKHCLKNRKS